MSLKKTLSLSLFLHLSFFAAVLLSSAELLESSSKILNEEVIFVKFTEDMRESGEEQALVKTQIFKLKKSSLKTEVPGENTLSPRFAKRHENKSGETSDLPHLGLYSQIGQAPRLFNEIFSEQNNNVLNTPEEPAHNASLTNYKDSGNGVVDILSKSKTNNDASDSSYSSESGGAYGGNKNRGILSPEIFEVIRTSIERAKTYPILARKKGIEGTVYISFRVNSEGKPQDIKILNSSGSNILDNATLHIVKKAAPFPYTDSPIEVPVVFRLN